MSGGSERPIDVAIVGAGIAGLCAAGELAAAGHLVAVVDKGRGVGGRMATRRLGAAVCDHGAQFFTVRGGSFGGLVADAQAAGSVATWCQGFAQAASILDPVTAAPDGHARWRGVQGMTDLPKFIARRLVDLQVDVRTGARVTAIGVVGDRVRLDVEGAAPIVARGCVVTAPVPQALEAFAAGGLLAGASSRIDPAAHRLLASVGYDPCFALMLVLDRPSRVPQPGAIQFATGPVAWLADNHMKGISPQPALTVHGSGAFSRERFDDPPEEVARELRRLALPWIGDATVVEESLQRWKYASPTTVLEVPLVAATVAPPIVCCGDAFAGPKVEGAASSGMAAGRWVGRVLGDA